MAAARPAQAVDEAALTFAARWAADVRPLLDCVDRVRPYLAGENIELPAIVVVGDQSSGKSSVLESISGIALPRGTNIVTRCPLELQLRRDTETYAIISRPAAVGLFGGDPSKMISERLTRLEDIGPAIERFTAEIAGANKGVSDRPISLRVHRPDAPDLTLIDLPGACRAQRGRTCVCACARRGVAGTAPASAQRAGARARRRRTHM
jgi:interferon-induced GTP-binding protein Mx1